jgi:hypothetical protein
MAADRWGRPLVVREFLAGLWLAPVTLAALLAAFARFARGGRPRGIPPAGPPGR